MQTAPAGAPASILRAMYSQFFGLAQEPFSIAPDPRYLFMSERHREALAHLLYGVRGGGGFVLLTGEIGAGKTTVCRCFLEQVPKRCNVAYIFNPKLTVEELLRTVCDEFRIPFRHAGLGSATVKDYVDALNEFLLRMHAIGQSNVLIIDEAQNLSPDVLEQLRLLTNLETAERKLLQIILIGQPELRRMLARPELEQLAQRVIARYHLEALSEAETQQYIRHRFAIAGLVTAVPFDRAALARIHELSRGVPRRINLLADRALLGAYALGTNRIGRDIVDKAAAEVFEPAPPPDRRLQRWQVAAVSLGALLLAGVAALLLRDGDLRWRSGNAPSAQAPAPVDIKPIAVAGDSGKAAAGAGDAKGDAAPAGASRPEGKSAATGTAVAGAAEATKGDVGAPRVDGNGAPARLAALLTPEDAALRELASAWGVTLTDGEPCAEAARQRLRCFRSRAGLPLLRRLDRPAVLAIDDGNGQRGHALLVALDAQGATLRQGATRQRVPLETLTQAWTGEFVTLWSVPTGYSDAAAADAAGPRGATAAWIAARLTRVDGTPADTAASGEPLRARLIAFQQQQGLRADGIAGPVTMMRLARASGVEEPQLDGNGAAARATASR